MTDHVFANSSNQADERSEGLGDGIEYTPPHGRFRPTNFEMVPSTTVSPDHLGESTLNNEQQAKAKGLRGGHLKSAVEFMDEADRIREKGLYLVPETTQPSIPNTETGRPTAQHPNNRIEPDLTAYLDMPQG